MLRQAELGMPVTGDRASFVRYAAYALATDRSKDLVGPQGLAAMAEKIGAGNDAMGFHRRMARAIPSRDLELRAVLDFVGTIEALRVPPPTSHTAGAEDDLQDELRISELARRLLGSSDERLTATVGSHWWPRLRSETTWRGPADVLIAADAAISRLETARRLSAWDTTGLQRTLEQLAFLLAGAGPATDDAVAHTAILIRSLYEHQADDQDSHPGLTGDALLHSFIRSVAGFPGTGQALRAMDRAVRSHPRDTDFAQYIAALFAELAELVAIEPWFPGSYLTRLIRVLGLYGTDETRTWAWGRLAEQGRAPGSLSNRRAATWAVMETVATADGWSIWRELVAALVEEDATRSVPEHSAFTRFANVGQGELVDRLRAAGATPVGIRGCFDLVTTRVRYQPDSTQPVDDDRRLTVMVPAAVWENVAPLLRVDDEKLRRRPGWDSMNSDTRSATVRLVEEMVLSSSIIRANIARETLLAAGPSVRLACEACATSLLGACASERDRLPVWFRERVLSLAGFVAGPNTSAAVEAISTVAEDREEPAELRARALLMIGDVLLARSGAIADRSRVAEELSRTLPTLGPDEEPTEVWTATVRVLGLLGAPRSSVQALVASGSKAPAEVRRMAFWADRVLS